MIILFVQLGKHKFVLCLVGLGFHTLQRDRPTHDQMEACFFQFLASAAVIRNWRLNTIPVTMPLEQQFSSIIVALTV